MFSGGLQKLVKTRFIGEKRGDGRNAENPLHECMRSCLFESSHPWRMVSYIRSQITAAFRSDLSFFNKPVVISLSKESLDVAVYT